MDANALDRPVTPWHHRRAFWMWARIFGALILAGVVSIPMGIAMRSWPEVGFGAAFIVAGLLFAVLVDYMTKNDQ